MTTAEKLQVEADERIAQETTGFPIDTAEEAGNFFLILLCIIGAGAFVAAVVAALMLL